MSESSATVTAVKSTTTRRIVTLVAIAFLVVQIAIPASYYFQDLETAERYSWRMFSSVDLSSWDAQLFVEIEEAGEWREKEVPLEATLQETHLKLVQKGQLDVVARLMQKLLESPAVRQVRYEARGTLPSGQAIDPIVLRMRSGDAEPMMTRS